MTGEERLARAVSDRYQIERELGSGGMSTVYLAEDLKHHRHVAIKVLRPELSAALGTERFLREIEVVASLNHPNILGLHDSGEADGLLYFVMPYVDGESLRDRLDRESSLPLQEAVRITREIGDALHYAHDHGLVHRDVKPENILFQAGHAVVCDFGIAQVASEAHDRLTRTGVAVGTFTYMSPEQLTDEGVVDRRTDVYALGCLFHEMLSGRAAFHASTPQASLAKKLTGTGSEFLARRHDLPQTLEAVLDRALAVQVEDRFPTVEAFTAALDTAVTASVVEKDTRTRRHRRALRLGAEAVGFVVLMAGAWWVSRLASGPSMGRIAVLPFINEADTSQAYLAQGVHQDLVLELAKAGIGVINPMSVARYAGSLLPVRDIAAELSVDGVVQGSTRLDGGQVSLELQLINGRSEEIVWVQSFREGLGELVTLYHEVTRAVAGEIGMELGEETRARLSQAQETDPQVTEALLQARFQYQKLTEEGFDTALDYYDLALERDSLSAEAWIGIAQVWGGRAQMGFISGDEANRLAQSALERARELDPSLSGVQRELAGRLVWSEWDWSGGEEAFLRALEADPTDSRTRASYSHLLLYLDRDAEALDQARQASELDPFNTLVHGFYGMTLNSLKRYQDAEAVLLPALARDPEAPILLSTLRTTYHLMGRHEEAMEMWRASYRSDPGALAALEEGYRSEGYSAALRAVADLLVERADTTYVRPWLVGTLFTRAGMADAAIPYLEQAFQEHDPNMPYIATDPIFDIMRQEPRFRALVERLGLPQ